MKEAEANGYDKITAIKVVTFATQKQMRKQKKTKPLLWCTSMKVA